MKKVGRVLPAAFTTGLCLAAVTVFRIDPLFHDHPPLTDSVFYGLDQERSINDGIAGHFRYKNNLTGCHVLPARSSDPGECMCPKGIISRGL